MIIVSSRKPREGGSVTILAFTLKEIGAQTSQVTYHDHAATPKWGAWN